MIKAIYFDMYQTLVDTDISERKEIKKQAFVQVFAKYLISVGVEVSKAKDFQANYLTLESKYYLEHDKSTRHHDFRKLIKDTFNIFYSIDVAQDILDKLIWDYRLATRGHVRLYDEVQKTLEELSKSYDIYLASYTQECFSLRELGELGIKKYFKGFIFSSEIGYKKSDINFYKECLKLTLHDPSECVMVGDNKISDVYVPSKLGFRTIWIKNPITMNDDKELEIVPDAELELNDIREIIKIIKSL